MSFGLHPAAAQAFDDTAEQLRNSIVQIPRSSLQDGPMEFEPEISAAHALGEDDIQNLSYGKITDPYSGELERIVYDDGNTAHELARANASQFNKLITSIWRSGDLAEKVSVHRIEDELAKWLDPSGHSEKAFCSHLVERVSPEVVSRTLWIPIANLHVQSAFEFGRTTFRPISEASISEWKGATESLATLTVEQLEGFFGEIRTKYQGHTAVEFIVVAEPSRAVERAIDEAERATTLLRTFCPENFHPKACSYTLPFGWCHPPSDVAWVSQGKGLFAANELMALPYPLGWEISDRKLEIVRKAGMEQLSRIAGANSPTDFEQKLIDALLIYNRASTTRGAVDKIIFILVALETMLLRNQTEPIQMAVSDRLAFAVGRSGNERRAIAALVRSCYSIRSRYIHHGAPSEEVGTMIEFMRWAWTFFSAMIQNAHRFQSKDQLLDYLGQIKYGG